jgi:hypothetical protein
MLYAVECRAEQYNMQLLFTYCTAVMLNHSQMPVATCF